jgi:rRNA biogenesis protein RRP5
MSTLEHDLKSGILISADLQVKARIIYDNLAVTPRRFALSVLPHIVGLTSPLAPGAATPIEETITIGTSFSTVEVVRVMNDWGLVCRTPSGLEGFAHVSLDLPSGANC